MAIIGISGKIGSGKDTVGLIIQYLTDRYAKENKLTFKEWMNEFSNINDGYYKSASSWEVKKFAYAVKQVCSILLDIPIEDFEKPEVKNKLLGKEWDRYVIDRQFESAAGHFIYKKYYFATFDEADAFLDKTCDSAIRLTTITVRELLQQVGTEAMRNMIHPNVWVNTLFNQYKAKKYNSGIDIINKYPNWLITDVRFPNEAEAILHHNGIIIRVNRKESVYKIDKTSTELHFSEVALDNHEFDYTINNNCTIDELIDIVKEILIIEEIIF